MEDEPAPDSNTYLVLGAKEKLQVFLAEYAAMRSEAVQRISTAYQLSAVVVAGAVLFVTQFDRLRLGQIIGSVLAAFILWMWVLMIRDTRRVTRRIRVVEAEVNKLFGEPLLTHETSLKDLWHRLKIL